MLEFLKGVKTDKALAMVLERTGIGRELAEAEERRNARSAAINAIPMLHAQRDEQLPGLDQAVSEAAKEYREAEKRFIEAGARLREADNARSRLINHIDLHVSRNSAVLRDTADPRIDDFRSELLRELEELRQRSYYGQPNVRKSAIARMQAISIAAREMVDELKLMPDPELGAEFARIRATLPEVLTEEPQVMPVQSPSFVGRV